MKSCQGSSLLTEMLLVLYSDLLERPRVQRKAEATWKLDDAGNYRERIKQTQGRKRKKKKKESNKYP